MATSVSLGYCLWLAGQTWNDSIGRNQMVAGSVYAGYSAGGVLMNNGNPLACSPTSGLSFNVTAGSCTVLSVVGDGSYMVANPTTQTLTCTTADPTNPRIDIVVVNVNDVGSNSSFAQIEIIAGTPAPSPSAPATPSNSLLLYNIAVAANQTTLNTSNFTDNRNWTAFAGGIVRCPNMSTLPPGGNGVIGYDVVNNRFFHLSASGAQPMSIQQYPPALASTTTPVNFASNAFQTLLSVNFNSDGSDVMITGRWTDLYTASATSQVTMRLLIDSVLVQYWRGYSGSATYSDGNYHLGGGTVVHQTSSLTGTTPSPGAHTASFVVNVPGSAGQVFAASNAPLQLGVSVIFT